MWTFLIDLLAGPAVSAATNLTVALINRNTADAAARAQALAVMEAGYNKVVAAHAALQNGDVANDSNAKP